MSDKINQFKSDLGNKAEDAKENLGKEANNLKENVEKDVNEFKENVTSGIKDGEYCGIEEFNGKKFNTCNGEEVTEKGYDNPDK